MIDPLEFVAIRKEVFLDYLSIQLDVLRTPCLACESGDRKQKLTDALKYCIDLLKKNEEMLYYKDSSLFCTRESEKSSQDMNSEEEQEKKSTKSIRKRLKIPLEYYEISVS